MWAEVLRRELASALCLLERSPAKKRSTGEGGRQLQMVECGEIINGGNCKIVSPLLFTVHKDRRESSLLDESSAPSSRHRQTAPPLEIFL